VIPADDSPPVTSGARSNRATTSRSCPTQSATTCLIIIHRSPGGHQLTSRRFDINIPNDTFDGQDVVGADAAARHSLLLGDAGWHDQQTLRLLTIDQITPHGTRLTTRQVGSIPAAAVMTFNPTGSRLLYVHGSRLSRRWLWDADIAGQHLSHPRVLIRRSQIGASAAW
ncbi:MAG TPA: hypothetical protein VFN61_10415, partial [Acidimicrobiales bacterium]|nr:hypothetical protein [Acidimicrobiales bacterium]